MKVKELKLIDLLIQAENGTLEDKQKVIIEDDIYYWDKEDKRFYDRLNNKCQAYYKDIYTNELDIPCGIFITGEEEVKDANTLNKLSYQQLGAYLLERHEFAEYNKQINEQISKMGSKINEIIDWIQNK